MAPRPTLVRERAVWAEEHLLVGVDEAGRGPLAGPVVAAAVVFPIGCAASAGTNVRTLCRSGATVAISPVNALDT